MTDFINLILLDAAKMNENIEVAKEINPKFDSLYYGKSKERLGEIAPYLFTFQKNNAFNNWYFENGWCNAWGILFFADASFEVCQKHFRKFLLVKTAYGKELYFRFYDPRVLSVFLPCCTQQQIIDFFGPIDYFVTEGDNKEQAHVFSHKNGILKQEELPVSKIRNQ